MIWTVSTTHIALGQAQHLLLWSGVTTSCGDFEVTVRRALDGRPGKSCVLVGLRGVGKTVLLNRFTEIAEHRKMKVGYVEASEGGDFPELLAVRLAKDSSGTGTGSKSPSCALGGQAGSVSARVIHADVP